MLKNYLTAIVTATLCILVGIAGAYAVSRWTGDPTPLPTKLETSDVPRDPEGVEPQTVTLSTYIGRPVTALGVTIEPLEVTEDSRCPSGVACIQAGTVRLRMAITTSLGASVEEIALGESITTGNEQLTLLAVEPNTTSASAIPTESYRFTFSVETR